MFAFGRFFKQVVLSTSVFLAAQQAHANLISTDFQADSGDGWITLDTVTGMEWLDVNLTAGQSFDQVRTGDWMRRGFRFATQQELLQLFINAGIPDDGYDVGNTHPAEALALALLLGPTIDAGSRVSVAGLVGTDFFGNAVSFATHPVGEPFSALVGKIDYIDLSFIPGWTAIGEAHFTGGHPFSNESDSSFGSFLVRGEAEPIPVPAPTTALLLAFSVLGLSRKRKTNIAD
ncbi:hypothetical protein HPT27_05460 [Permianibacter sp. IMCC34836]|uniref:hypothetical protein n=1 Tax=Permianibacter fluminis TaxID=2738515 RepID=UPI001553ACF6|nr:hypothetical protein [Permianibacter fluminis]NQD36466.1 hypothetical protein [Permianibacter fluminis]